MRLQQPVVLFLLMQLFIFCVGCNNAERNEPALSLHPEKGKQYQFSLLRTGLDTSYMQRVHADTFRLEGKLETLNEEDSVTHFRFTFSGFRIGSSIQKSTVTTIDKSGRRRTETFSVSDERDSILNLLTGMHTILMINRKGEVLAVEGLEELMDSVSAARTVAVSSVSRTFEKYLGENTMKDIFNRVFYLFPAKEVKVSEQWGNDITLIAKAPVLFSNMYTLEGVMNDRAIVRITSLISARAGEEGKLYMQGNQSGIAEVSRLKGLPLHLETISSYITTIDHYDSTGKEKLKTRREEKMVVDIAEQ
jgi:hypothetical protein